MKILVVLGTRPELIKLASVIYEARSQQPKLKLIVCSTGQHKEMLSQAMQTFNIVPDESLDLMQPNHGLVGLTARLLTGIDSMLQKHHPDVVIVQGDTATAFAGAYAAFLNGIPVAHIEAGLRTGDLTSPFPEEGNRLLISRLAKWHFAPTEQAANSLLIEGISPLQIKVTGNTVVDAVEIIKNKWSSHAYQGYAKDIYKEKPIILVTTHRRENFGSGLKNICKAIRILSEAHPELGFVFPAHLNPNVREVVINELGNIENLLITNPVDFETCLYLQSRALVVLTDSGGIQEECPSFGVPCIVMRKNTERGEGVTAGIAKLVGVEVKDIVETFEECITLNNKKDKIAYINPYGDGRSAEKILSTIISNIKNND